MDAPQKKVGQEWICPNMKMKRISWSVIIKINKCNCIQLYYLKKIMFPVILKDKWNIESVWDRCHQVKKQWCRYNNVAKKKN